jgi:cytochrome b involved in lipid metabolism
LIKFENNWKGKKCNEMGNTGHHKEKEKKPYEIKYNKELKQYSIEEVSEMDGNKVEECWIIVDKKVYDLTAYLKTGAKYNDENILHPVGSNIIKKYGGKDCSEIFNKRPCQSDYCLYKHNGFDLNGEGYNGHEKHSDIALKMMEQFYIGNLKE